MRPGARSPSKPHLTAIDGFDGKGAGTVNRQPSQPFRVTVTVAGASDGSEAPSKPAVITSLPGEGESS